MSERRTTHVDVEGADLKLRLTWCDKMAALVGDQTVQLTAIRDVAVVPEPLRAISGVRSPGLAIPGITKVGVWRRHGRRTLVVVRRGQQAVRIEADGQRFDSYLIGVDDPIAAAARIRRSIHPL